MSEEQHISLAKIRADGGTQPRSAINEDLANDYAERMNAGDKFPPIVVFFDGSDYWLADGFHRVLAQKAIDRKRVLAEVHQGTRRDAVLHSVGVNSEHGARRTNADKRRAVNTLLRDDEWSGWSDREIAKRCRVHNSFVSRLRPDLTVAKRQSESRTYTTKHGTPATMKTAGINAGRPKAKPAPRQDLEPESPDDLVPWPKPSPEQERERKDFASRLFKIFNALEGLANSPMTPSEFIEECPETSEWRVDEHLDAAVDWISQFSKEWKESR